MVHLCARSCSQLRAGALLLGLMRALALEPVHGDVVQQKEYAEPVESMSLRLGSGAVATGYDDLTTNLIAPTKMTLLKSERFPAGKTLLPTPGKNHDPIPIYMKMNQNIVKLLGIAVVAILFYMMPG